MTKTKTLKRAMLMSLFALIICVSMFVGSTFAWFTDSVTSVGNIIKSGTLDVTMEWADGKTDPTNTTWTDASTGAIFNSELWEPGYVEVRHIKIANAGTLALKYQLNILANGAVSELADVIDVYYVDPAQAVENREALATVEKIGTLSEVLAKVSTTAAGELKAGENHTITLALKMQETAGNEYQDKSIGSDFSVQLLATQLTSEEDAFDNQYDKYATVATVADMKTALEEGQTNFNFMGNTINLNYGLNRTGIPAGTTVTIANANVSGRSYGNGVDGTVVFEDCTFTNTGAYSIHFDNGTGDIIFNNCTLEGWCSFGATINSVKMNNCTIKGNGIYGIVRFYQDAELNNCIVDCSNSVLTDIYPDGVSAVTPNGFGANEFITVKLNNCSVVYATYECGKGSAVEDGVILVDGVKVATSVEDLSDALASGEDVVLAEDTSKEATATAPYGNFVGFEHNGGVFDGNGKTVGITNGGDNYAVMTSGGTIKNLTVNDGFRGIMIMNPTQDVILNNVVSSGDVCYALNTGEGDGTHSLIATNSTFNGWSSIGTAVKDVTFTNCTFGQGEYYTNVFGRLVKPYVNAVFNGCEFNSKFYIDLSQLGKDGDGNVLDPNAKIVLRNCTVNGVKLTTENWKDLIVSEDDCGEGQISIEAKDGSYMTASNVLNYVVIE